MLELNSSMQIEVVMKREKAIVLKRRREIFEAMQKKPQITVSELANMFFVTELTIRRDWKQLEQSGKISRFHGGAKVSDYPIKIEETTAVKMGKMCAKLIDDFDTIFINSSDFTPEIIKNISRKNVTVITNYAKLSDIKLPDKVKLISTGGEYLANSKAFYGDYAVENIRKITAKKSFISASGVSLNSGITCEYFEEVSVNKAMKMRTIGQTYIIAQEESIGKVCSFNFDDIDEQTHIITQEENINNFRLCGAEVTTISKG